MADMGDKLGFFPRDRELKGLKGFASGCGGLLLLTGPPDCGKTAILKKLASEEEGITWIDMRGVGYTSADRFARKLGAELGGTSRLDSIGLEFEWPSIGISLHNKCVHLEFQEALLNYLHERKAKAGPSGAVPTIIFDEADLLRQWHGDEASQKALSSFLAFFVKVTKQDNLANIIMATSDYLFKFWLEQTIGAFRFSKVVIGDLPEAEARAFLDYMRGYPCADVVWKDVYAMCGGRALLLARFSARNSSDYWTSYLEEVYDNAYQEVRLGLQPGILRPRDVPICWNADSYAQIMKELCKHEDGVMSWDDLVALPFCGPEVARALVCYNLLLFRDRSTYSRDLTWYKGTWPIVMPMSRAHFAAMRDMVGRHKGKGQTPLGLGLRFFTWRS